MARDQSLKLISGPKLERSRGYGFSMENSLKYDVMAY